MPHDTKQAETPQWAIEAARECTERMDELALEVASEMIQQHRPRLDAWTSKFAAIIARHAPKRADVVLSAIINGDAPDIASIVVQRDKLTTALRKIKLMSGPNSLEDAKIVARQALAELEAENAE